MNITIMKIFRYGKEVTQRCEFLLPAAPAGYSNVNIFDVAKTVRQCYKFERAIRIGYRYS